jgi:hypothetical protein
MQSCHNVGRISPGEHWSVRAHYDTAKHVPMKTAGGLLEPVMGIGLIYAVAAAPIPITFRREVLLLLVVTAVVGSGIVALYILRRFPDLQFRRLYVSRRAGWQRVNLDDTDEESVDDYSVAARDDRPRK